MDKIDTILKEHTEKRANDFLYNLGSGKGSEYQCGEDDEIIPTFIRCSKCGVRLPSEYIHLATVKTDSGLDIKEVCWNCLKKHYGDES